MIYQHIEKFLAAIPEGTRLLAMDHGTKTIGLALSDPDLKMASPFKTLKRTKFSNDIKDIADIVAEYSVGAFVIGLPVNMDGGEGPRCESVRHFVDNMVGQYDNLGWGRKPILFEDERLSTAAAQDFLIEERDMSRGKRKEIVDALAAQMILQSVIEKIIIIRKKH